MKDQLLCKISPTIVEMAQELYQCVITAVVDEMVVVKEEQLVLPSDESVDNDFEPFKCCIEQKKEIKKEMEEEELKEEEVEDELKEERVEEEEELKGVEEEEEEEEEEWMETKERTPRQFIPLEYKKRVVAMAKAHPKWSLTTLQRNGGRLLKKKSLLKNWEADIAAGLSMFEKYYTINTLTLKRFEEAQANSEHVTTTILQQWGMEIACEVQCKKFTASKNWVKRFKKKFNICC